MHTVRMIFWLFLVALGLLWSLQGADLIRIKPILCVANCEPLVGGSVAFFILGLVAMAVGLGVLVMLKRWSE